MSTMGPRNYAAFNILATPGHWEKKGVKTFKGKYKLYLQNNIYSLNSKF